MALQLAVMLFNSHSFPVSWNLLPFFLSCNLQLGLLIRYAGHIVKHFPCIIPLNLHQPYNEYISIPIVQARKPRFRVVGRWVVQIPTMKKWWLKPTVTPNSELWTAPLYWFPGFLWPWYKVHFLVEKAEHLLMLVLINQHIQQSEHMLFDQMLNLCWNTFVKNLYNHAVFLPSPTPWTWDFISTMHSSTKT